MQVPSHNRLASSLGASTSGRPISASDCSRPLSFRRPTALSHSGWETLHSLQQSPVQQQQSSRQRLSRGTTHSHCRQQQVRLLCSAAQHSNGTSSKGPVIVIDNYDSFTYNLCQVYHRRRTASTHSESIHHMVIIMDICSIWVILAATTSCTRMMKRASRSCEK